MATQQQSLARLDALMRRGDVDGMASMLRQQPDLVRSLDGAELQRFLVDRPEMRDFMKEISTVNRAIESEADTGAARNVDLMRRLGTNQLLMPRFLQQSRAQAELEGARARGETAAQFEKRRNTPGRNAPVEQVLGAAAEGYQKGGDIGATAAGATGLGLGIASAIAGILAPLTGGATAGLAAGLGAASTATTGGAEIAKQIGMADVNRRLAAVGREAAAEATRAPSYTQMYQTPTLSQGPAEQALDLTGNTQETSGFLYT